MDSKRKYLRSDVDLLQTLSELERVLANTVKGNKIEYELATGGVPCCDALTSDDLKQVCELYRHNISLLEKHGINLIRDYVNLDLYARHKDTMVNVTINLYSSNVSYRAQIPGTKESLCKKVMLSISQVLNPLVTDKCLNEQSEEAKAPQ